MDKSVEDLALFNAAFYVYLGIFVALIAAGVGFPIPEELPIVTAGALVGHAAEPPPPIPPQFGVEFMVAPFAPFPANLPWAALDPRNRYEMPTYTPSDPIALRWWIMLPLCICGVVLSDGLLYGMGRYFGPKLLERPTMKRIVPPEKRERIERNFHKYGVYVLLFARFLPAIRSPIFIMAGIMRISLARFLLADGLYAIPGVSLLFVLAFWFGDQFRDLIVRAEGKIDRLKPVLILLLITAVGSYLVYHFWSRPVSAGDPKELPIIGRRVAEHISHNTDHVNSEPPTAVTTPDAAARPPDHS